MNFDIVSALGFCYKAPSLPVAMMLIACALTRALLMHKLKVKTKCAPPFLRNRLGSIVGVLLTLATTARPASPGAVLLYDSFNANTSNTFDLNIDLARQTGVLAPIPY